ncbi:MAG: radical SAM protein [Desulfuromonadaceae bacterium]|nr:radical SAM protein [Desulfuromonadaceae bacterium]
MSNNFHMDGHKLFWHLDRVSAWQDGELIAPIYVEISPVSYCNHNCVFCGIDFARSERLSLDSELLCQRIVEMGLLGVKSVMFAGEGEPLLHRDLAQMVSCAKGAGIDVSITTNGSAANHDLWEQLLPDLSWLRFSMDAGSTQVYAKVHQVSGEIFDKTVANIRDALSVRQRLGLNTTIGVQYLILPENLDDLAAAISVYNELGVDYISFKPYSEHPQMLNKSGLIYTQEMLDKVESLIDSSQPGLKTKLIYRKASAESYRTGVKAFSQCSALPFWGYISSKGDFYTCSVYLNDERFCVGNIKDENMKDILFGKRRRNSVTYGMTDLHVGDTCRTNCRMARINEFLEFLNNRPDHLNFI